MINCLVVDDEELARTLLKNYIARLPHLALAGECKNPLDALDRLNQERVDLIFLDIQMPELTGTEFIKTLSNKPLVIFTTAYPDYALEGYALDVVDYLLKPIGFDRFLLAVNKAAERRRLREMPSVGTAAEAEPPKDFVLVKSEHRLHRLKLDDILYIEGMAEYVAFHTRSSGRLLSLMSLKQLEGDLPADRFLRIHKSYIVASAHVSVLEGNQVVIGKVKLPLGASYREEVLRRVF